MHSKIRQKDFMNDSGYFNNVHILNELLRHSNVKTGVVVTHMTQADETLQFSVMGNSGGVVVDVMGLLILSVAVRCADDQVFRELHTYDIDIAVLSETKKKGQGNSYKDEAMDSWLKKRDSLTLGSILDTMAPHKKVVIAAQDYEGSFGWNSDVLNLAEKLQLVQKA
ncbi:unnamed protein product [Acanthoscelides obtectus]|uniref:Uncharacterized protein n=1 Tax=Acanthoscelides obtectus TaxID=200917 RepID=A0A9P0K145_ACAOB|nr:unnamed protein product [Acanthoscelides obtectus]CAK1669612.1 hypothetical protein AOBTE_LOCUS27105 [Acanthoscelides obtectus]